MKFVPKEPPPEMDNSSGGGLEGFFREAALMLAAHWVLAALLFIAIVALMASIGILVSLFD
jgi:hypothetical protein